MRLPQQWNAEVLYSLSLSLFFLVCVCGSNAWVSTCPFFAALHSRVQEPEFALAAVARHGKDVEARPWGWFWSSSNVCIPDVVVQDQ